MKFKTAFSFVLLTIVAVSVVFALLKVTPDAATSQDQTNQGSPRRRWVLTQSLLRLSFLLFTFMHRIDAQRVARLKASRTKR
jgi:predicted MFS family arabinose efflux permease